MRVPMLLTVLVAAVGCVQREPTASSAAGQTCAGGGTAATTTLWLDFAGANVVYAAADDAAAMPVQSRLAPASGASVPAFDATPIAPRVTRDQAIAAIVDRVRTLFLPYAVDIVTTRPVWPPYTRVLVGGSHDLLGDTAVEAGLAVVDCDNAIGNDVAYDFAAEQTPDYGGVVGIANVAAHEAGHSFGLEHVDSPHDVMYAAALPMLTLSDFFTLGFGSANFSSYPGQTRQCTSVDPVDEAALLGCVLGRRGSGGDTVAPALSWDPPAGDVDGALTVTVDASDDAGLPRVEIYKDLELMAVLAQPPYSASIAAAPGERFYVTVEAIDAAANRTTITRSFAATTNPPGGDGGGLPDGATPPPPPAVKTQAGGCALLPVAAAPPPWTLLLLVALAIGLRNRRRRH